MIASRFLIIIFLFIGLTGYAEDLELILWNKYEVVKTEKNDSLKEGQCLIKGLAVNVENKNPIVAGYFSDVNHKNKVTTNADGKFNYLTNEGGAAMYFYHPEYGEIIIPNSIIKPQYNVEIKLLMKYQLEEVEVDKPVIYLYAKKKTPVNIELKPKGDLTFTYPVYKNKWEVNVGPDSMEVEGKAYPYLFWEAKHKRLNFKGDELGMDGFYIKTDSTIQFLEDQLSKLGLNRIETTDFITFWGPRIQAYPFAAIQFWVDNDYNEYIADIDVSPKPESSRRIFMVFKGVKEDMKIDYFKPQNFKPIKRTGLTLIEWGGAEL